MWVYGPWGQLFPRFWFYWFIDLYLFIYLKLQYPISLFFLFLKIIVDLQCSVNFCYMAKWPSYIYVCIYVYIYIHTHLYVYILLLTVFSIVSHQKWLDIVPCAMQQDLIAYQFQIQVSSTNPKLSVHPPPLVLGFIFFIFWLFGADPWEQLFSRFWICFILLIGWLFRIVISILPRGLGQVTRSYQEDLDKSLCDLDPSYGSFKGSLDSWKNLSFLMHWDLWLLRIKSTVSCIFKLMFVEFL